MRAKGYTRETILNYGMTEREFPSFVVGDTISVVQRIIEAGVGDKKENKERLQAFEGDVIAIHKNGMATTFTVRKIGAHNIPVERIFPLYCPIIKTVTVIRHGAVRRAKLYYLRKRIGKAARVQEAVKVSASATVQD
jgi:large subunit ribosomal protein L19